MRQKAVFIPPYCGDEVKSNAERKMFEVLQDLDLKHAVILHSLGLPKHQSKVYGEIDFVVICERGIACLEIKGGKIECKNGQWFFTNRNGNVFQKNEGPFAQVIGNMFSLKSIIKSQFQNNYRFYNVLFASGVVFPEIKFASYGEEIIRDIIYDQTSEDITQYIITVFDYWEEQQHTIPTHLTPKEIQEITTYLRGEFLFQPSLGSRIEDVDRFLLKYTEEQKTVINGLAGNRHLIIKGGAGTGKTLCALDYALSESKKGKKILYLTFNKNLANTLKQEVENNEKLKIINIHGLFGEFIKVDLEQLKKNSKGYFEEIMPEQFYNYLKNLTNMELEDQQFDGLVIDEAQDILRLNYLACLEPLLKGGFDEGKWAIFYDEKQNLFNPQFEEGLEMLKSYAHTNFNLFTNCRNTRKIAEFNSKISEYELNELLREDGEEVSIINYHQEENFENEIRSLIKTLKKEKVSLENVVFLSPKRYGNSQLKNCLEKVCRVNELNDQMIKDKNKPIFATIQGYKGLDAKVVILIDTDKIFDQNFSKYMYISISRARAKLYVMVNEKIYKEKIQS